MRYDSYMWVLARYCCLCLPCCSGLVVMCKGCADAQLRCVLFCSLGLCRQALERRGMLMHAVFASMLAALFSYNSLCNCCDVLQVLIRMKVKEGATAPELARLVYIRNTKIAGERKQPACCMWLLHDTCCSASCAMCQVSCATPRSPVRQPARSRSQPAC